MKHRMSGNGFTLIEMLLAVVIVSLLMGLLFTILFQTSRAVRTVDRLADGHSTMVLVNQVMTRDLTGAYIPLQYEWQQQQQKKQQSQQKNSTTPTQEEPKPALPLLTHIFYGEAQDTLMRELTFITTNPLPSYWDGKIGKAKPRVVRVTYRLQPHEHNTREKPLYTLMREESFDVLYSDQKKTEQERVHVYPVIHGIRHMKITYSVIVPMQNDANKSSTSEGSQLRTLQFWNVEREQGNQELIKHGIMLPTLVTVELLIAENTRDSMYMFTVAIPSKNTYEQTKSPAHTEQPTSVKQQEKQESLKQENSEIVPSALTEITVKVNNTQQSEVQNKTQLNESTQGKSPPKSHLVKEK